MKKGTRKQILEEMNTPSERKKITLVVRPWSSLKQENVSEPGLGPVPVLDISGPDDWYWSRSRLNFGPGTGPGPDPVNVAWLYKYLCKKLTEIIAT